MTVRTMTVGELIDALFELPRDLTVRAFWDTVIGFPLHGVHLHDGQVVLDVDSAPRGTFDEILGEREEIDL